MNKEEIFDIIEEYNNLGIKYYTIEFIGNKKEKLNEFHDLIVSEGFRSVKKDEYIINGITKRKLDKKGIKYMVIV